MWNPLSALIRASWRHGALPTTNIWTWSNHLRPNASNWLEGLIEASSARTKTSARSQTSIVGFGPKNGGETATRRRTGLRALCGGALPFLRSAVRTRQWSPIHSAATASTRARTARISISAASCRSIPWASGRCSLILRYMSSRNAARRVATAGLRCHGVVSACVESLAFS